MVRLLDQSRAFSEVHGLPGAAFEQDGVLFKGNGSVADSVEHIVEDMPELEIENLTPYIFCIEQKSESSDPIIAHAENGKNLHNMHWKHLKALVEIYGGIWENKERAIAFLEGK